MATLKEVVLKHHQKEDGTFNVKIRVGHNRQTAYIPTNFHVVKKQLNKDYEIKDITLKKTLLDLLEEYTELIYKNAKGISIMSARELADALQEWKQQKEFEASIDFVAFALRYIEKNDPLREKMYYINMRGTVKSLIDFFGKDKIDITEISVKNLKKYEDFLKRPRVMVRPNRLGKMVKIKRPGMGNGISDRMACIRAIFNAARSEYNDEDNGKILIPHYPFAKYKTPKKKDPKKRALKPELICKLINYKDVGARKPNNIEFARDMIILSFYLVGMNATDLYNAKTFKDGRIMYNRMKTKGRRSDNAFISIKLEPEAMYLYEKYKDTSGEYVFNFKHLFKTEKTFYQGINYALRTLTKKMGLDETITTYHARHSWASIARNYCGVSNDDISDALNHSIKTVTQLYIEKDFTNIDRANRKVIDLINDTLLALKETEAVA